MKQLDFNSLAQTLFVTRINTKLEFDILHLKQYLLNVLIEDDNAQTDVELTFSNPYDDTVEGKFIIPCPKKLDTRGFIFQIDGQRAPLKLSNKKKLREINSKTLDENECDSVESLDVAFLQTKSLKIPAKSACKIQIGYIETVEETEDNYVFTHPLKSHQSLQHFGVSIAISGYKGVDAIECPSHDAKITHESDRPAQLTYQVNDIMLDTDFVCSYSFKDVSLVPDEEEYLDVLSASDGILKNQERLSSQDDPSVRSRPVESFLSDVPPPKQRGATRRQPELLSLNAPVLSNVSLGLNPTNGAPYHDVFHKGHGTNPFYDTEDDNLSTFAMDTDSASYSILRRYLQDGHLPPSEAVRVEEFINAFGYNYPAPTDEAFSIHLEGAPSKYGKGKRLKMLRIGIQGKVIPDTDRKDAILTFVIDVSGSMGMENRLGLVKKALRLLVEQLRSNDKIGIVVYGTNARVVLPHTSVVNKQQILEKIDALCPEGVTNAEDGIRKGYELASRNLQQNSINRVVLCSDGVANEGITSPELLLREIRDYVDEGIYLTTVGFGMGNYNDILMEELAKKGNGNYAYVDRLKEAKRIFVENLTGTLQVIAKDAKIQVKFNEDTVSRFRLIGYENRQMKHEDFRNDEADAGEIGSGHSVTALYEIKLCKNVDKGKLATVYIRHENPDTAEVSEVKERISVEDIKDGFDDASLNLQFAASVAQFAEILRESVWVKEGSLAAVQRTLKGILPKLNNETSQYENQKKELFGLVRNARRLKDMNDALKC